MDSDNHYEIHYFKHFYNSSIEIISQESNTILIPPCEVRGVIQFVGGSISGSIPLIKCGKLIATLCEKGYIIIAYRFSFVELDHFKIAIDLYKQQQAAKDFLVEEFNGSRHREINIDLSDRSQYYWLAYSMGCRLVTLLEILSKESDKKEVSYNSNYETLNNKNTHQNIWDFIKYDEKENYIRDQRSVLLAPEITNTFSVSISIPTFNLFDFFESQGVNGKSIIFSIEDALKNIQLFVDLYLPFFDGKFIIFPDSEIVKNLIKQSFKDLFGITTIIHFEEDSIAGDDVDLFDDLLANSSHKASHGFKLVKRSGDHDTPCSSDPEEVKALADEIDRHFISPFGA